MIYESQELNIDELFICELKYILESFTETMGEL